MKQHFIIKNNQKHLLLFFAGWGMDETPFLTIHPVDKDWMICYDYRSLTFDVGLLETYSQITLIAWSMGVWAASQLIKQYPHTRNQRYCSLYFRWYTPRIERTNLAEISKKDVWFNS